MRFDLLVETKMYFERTTSYYLEMITCYDSAIPFQNINNLKISLFVHQEKCVRMFREVGFIITVKTGKSNLHF